MPLWHLIFLGNHHIHCSYDINNISLTIISLNKFIHSPWLAGKLRTHCTISLHLFWYVRYNKKKKLVYKQLIGFCCGFTKVKVFVVTKKLVVNSPWSPCFCSLFCWCNLNTNKQLGAIAKAQQPNLQTRMQQPWQNKKKNKQNKQVTVIYTQVLSLIGTQSLFI